jgi:WD40 repeat protein
VLGEDAQLRITAVTAEGDAVDAHVRVAAPRGRLRWSDGTVTALQPGTHEVIATLVLPAGVTGEPLTLRVPVTVTQPPIARLEISAAPGRLYEGTTLGHSAVALHADGSERHDAQVRWSSSDPGIATVDAFGNVTAVAVGRVGITASYENARASLEHQVAPLAANRLEITGGTESIRTGDVQTFRAAGLDAAGNEVGDLPITWAHTYSPAQGMLGTSAHGQLLAGRFVADVPGVYTVLASAGPLTARRSFRVTERDAVRKLRVVGQGTSSRVRTTDLWPFEGRDGRDYALTGAKLSDGFAFVWDITDPSNIFKTDSVQVDARTINDVKVSPDGRYGVLTREGASDRRNGVIILDLSTPAHPTVASIFDQELTGGVHNAYALDDYLFAVSGGDKYVIIDVRDITAPRYVSEYNHPDSRIHDVWVHDGVAYSAEWSTGVVMVDVGTGAGAARSSSRS